MGGAPAGAPAPKQGAKASVPQEPTIDPQADRLLREAGDYLKAAQQLSFHAAITYDDLLPTGQKIELAADYDVAVRRPDRVYTEYWSDTGGRHFWYDGQTVTLYDPGPRRLRQRAGQADHRCDARAPHQRARLHPAAQRPDDQRPRGDVAQERTVRLPRRPTDVDGVRCHHLAFVERDIDWQVWIEDGTRRTPRKVVITYKSIPGAPQFSAVLSDWDFATRPPTPCSFRSCQRGRIASRSSPRPRRRKSPRREGRPDDHPAFDPNLQGLGDARRVAHCQRSGAPGAALAWGRGGGFGGGFRGGGGGFRGFGGGGFGSHPSWGGGGGRFGGTGFGGGGFGGGGLGSVSGSGGAAHDWSSTAASGNWQNAGERQAQRQGSAEQMQQTRDSEANSLQQNRDSEANTLQHNQYNQYNNYNHYYGGGCCSSSAGDFYGGLAVGAMAGLAVGAAVASLPAYSQTVVVQGTPYYYANGTYYAPQGTQYVVVQPPQGALISTLPGSCPLVYGGSSSYFYCNGTFYAQVSGGYQVVLPPGGVFVDTLPNGAVPQSVNGARYFQYGSVWYQPYYSGSDVTYETVANPNG